MYSERPAVTTRLQHHIRTAAQLWMRGLLGVAGAIFLGIILILVGLSSPGSSIPPLFTIVREHPVVSLVIGALLLFATLSALLIARLPDPLADGTGARLTFGVHLPRIAISTGISTASATLFVALLVTVLVRPVWCPNALCPKAEPPIGPGVHDSRLDVYVNTVQSGAFVLSDIASTYTQDNLPRAIGAMRIDQVSQPTSLSRPSSLSPYRVSVGVHNLTQGEYPLLIERVDMTVRDVSPLPYPLNVWTTPAGASYTTNPYQATYHAEDVGATIPATYLPLKGGHVQLGPGEADQLNLHIASLVVKQVRFQIQITYRAANESQVTTLMLPDTFQVDFSNAGDWNPYELQDGRLVPATGAS